MQMNFFLHKRIFSFKSMIYKLIKGFSKPMKPQHTQTFNSFYLLSFFIYIVLIKPEKSLRYEILYWSEIGKAINNTSKYYDKIFVFDNYVNCLCSFR